ncbi:cell division protein FTSH (mitochondrion) [Glycine soja]|uniref:Cell division protein FTSH n=1 Tax=Glycine soja TaxID=3848 RepID=A0A386JND4_GLYSO|nr:cell division protein FTSH [Glycine soja]AYD72972.1 cell division protein FTSH [Glycine soja]
MCRLLVSILLLLFCPRLRVLVMINLYHRLYTEDPCFTSGNSVYVVSFRE